MKNDYMHTVFLVCSVGLGIPVLITSFMPELTVFSHYGRMALVYLALLYGVVNQLIIRKISLFNSEVLEGIQQKERELKKTQEDIIQERKNKVYTEVYDSLRNGIRIETIIHNLRADNYSEEFVKECINDMVNEGVILVDETEPEQQEDGTDTKQEKKEDGKTRAKRKSK